MTKTLAAATGNDGEDAPRSGGSPLAKLAAKCDVKLEWLAAHDLSNSTRLCRSACCTSVSSKGISHNGVRAPIFDPLTGEPLHNPKNGLRFRAGLVSKAQRRQEASPAERLAGPTQRTHRHIRMSP